MEKLINIENITKEITGLITYIKENGYQIIVAKNDYSTSGFAKKYTINAGDSDDKILTDLRIFKTKIASEIEKEMFVNRPFIKNIEDIINETK
jgi:hypothetical protein